MGNGCCCDKKEGDLHHSSSDQDTPTDVKDKQAQFYKDLTNIGSSMLEMDQNQMNQQVQKANSHCDLSGNSMYDKQLVDKDEQRHSKMSLTSSLLRDKNFSSIVEVTEWETSNEKKQEDEITNSNQQLQKALQQSRMQQTINTQQHTSRSKFVSNSSVLSSDAEDQEHHSKDGDEGFDEECDFDGTQRTVPGLAQHAIECDEKPKLVVGPSVPHHRRTVSRPMLTKLTFAEDDRPNGRTTDKRRESTGVQNQLASALAMNAGRRASFQVYNLQL